MLTRTSEVDDIAPDVSVFARERDPQTGGRQLEEMAFEILITQALDAGETEGKVKALLLILATRSLNPTEAEETKLLSSRNNAEIERWLERAVSCKSVAELLT